MGVPYALAVYYGSLLFNSGLVALTLEEGLGSGVRRWPAPSRRR
jgi:hypothetical protein